MVAENERITVANIKNVPLEKESCNVVVFCLSLMGVDYSEFLREANRILKQKYILSLWDLTDY